MSFAAVISSQNEYTYNTPGIAKGKRDGFIFQNDCSITRAIVNPLVIIAMPQNNIPVLARRLVADLEARAITVAKRLIAKPMANNLASRISGPAKILSSVGRCDSLHFNAHAPAKKGMAKIRPTSGHITALILWLITISITLY